MKQGCMLNLIKSNPWATAYYRQWYFDYRKVERLLPKTMLFLYTSWKVSLSPLANKKINL